MSIVNRPNGRTEIQFKAPDGKRKTIRLGVVSVQQARDFSRRVDQLVSAKMLAHPLDHSLLTWLRDLPAATRKKLVAAGLVESAGGPHSISALIEAHEKSLAIADSTRGTLKYVRENLKKFFGESRDIATITPADADEFRAWLPAHGADQKGSTLAETTCSRMAKRAKQMFEYATTKKKWLPENPFGHMTGWKDSNRERDYFVSLDLTQRILDAATNAEFRAIVALSRGAALRCPSEILQLRWEWIDWEGGWIHPRVPKNRRYEGKEIRDVPLFPLARKYLDELHQVAPERQPLVFPNHQMTGAGVTSELQRVCRSINVALWAKPWQNMRASCETELLESFPVTVVTAWVGHSPRVMQKHYLLVVKEHHTKAIRGSVASPFASPEVAKVKPT